MRRAANGVAPAVTTVTTVVARSISEDQRQQTLLKTGALQPAILNSANFSSIATDQRGAIQILNGGAERRLG